MFSVVLQLPPRSQTQIRIHKLRQRRHVAVQSSTIYVNGSRLYFVHFITTSIYYHINFQDLIITGAAVAST